jgi:hypothetical protein
MMAIAQVNYHGRRQRMANQMRLPGIGEFFKNARKIRLACGVHAKAPFIRRPFLQNHADPQLN